MTLDGGDAIKIDDADLRVPLEEVASVAAVNTGRSQQARRLLITALEARLLNNAGKEVLGLLAEAHAPRPRRPPRRLLVRPLASRRRPGQSGQRRLRAPPCRYRRNLPRPRRQARRPHRQSHPARETAPSAVDRIDSINLTAPHQNADAETRRLYAFFRIVDQHDSPIPRTAFRIESSGNDEKLETYDDGYYLYAFDRDRHSSMSRAASKSSALAWRAARSKFAASANRAADAGEFQVKCFTTTRPPSLALAMEIQAHRRRLHHHAGHVRPRRQ